MTANEQWLHDLEFDPGSIDPQTDIAWKAELESRLAQIEAGNFEARDWRESVAEIRRSISNHA